MSGTFRFQYDNSNPPCYECDRIDVLLACSTVARRGKYKYGYTNAVDVTTIFTTPAHGETGWWQKGSYREYYILYDNTGSGPPTVVASDVEVGYDWEMNITDKVVEDFGEVQVNYTYVDQQAAYEPLAPGEYWVLDRSELFDLLDEVVEDDIRDFITDLTESRGDIGADKPWLSLSDIPPDFLPYTSGYTINADGSGGKALKTQWRPQFIPDGYFDEPATTSIKIGLTGTPNSLSGSFKSGDYALGDPSPVTRSVAWDASLGIWQNAWQDLPFNEDTEGDAEVATEACYDVAEVTHSDISAV